MSESVSIVLTAVSTFLFRIKKKDHKYDK